MLAAWENGEEKFYCYKVYSYFVIKKSKELAGVYCNFTKLSSIYSLKTFTEIYAEEPLLIYLVFCIYMRGMCKLSLRKCYLQNGRIFSQGLSHGTLEAISKWRGRM